MATFDPPAYLLTPYCPWRRRARAALWSALPIILPLFLLSFTAALLILFKFHWGLNNLQYPISVEMSERLGRQVTVHRVSGNVFTNVVLHGLTVARNDPREGSLLRAESVVVHYHLMALLRGEVPPLAAVSEVEIEAPQTYVERSNDGKINFLELVKTTKPAPLEKRFRGHIVVRNGRVDYLDYGLTSPTGQPLHLELAEVGADADFTVPDHIRVYVRTSELLGPSPQLSRLRGQVSLDTTNKATAISLLASDLDLEALMPHVEALRRLATVSGSATIQANLLVKPATKQPLPSGRAQGQTTVDYHLAVSTPHSIVSLPQLRFPIHLSGSAMLSPDLVFLQGMKVAGGGFAGSVTGEVTDFSRPQLRLNVSADSLDFNRIQAFLPASLRRYALGFAAPGSGAFSVWGDLRRPHATGELALPRLSLAFRNRQTVVGAELVRIQTGLNWPTGAFPAFSGAVALESPLVRYPSLLGRASWLPQALLTSGPVSVNLNWVGGHLLADGRFDLKGTETQVMGSGLPLQMSGRFALGRDVFSLQDVTVTSPVGSVEARASFVPNKPDRPWSVEGRLEGVRLDRLVAFLPLKHRLEAGALSGNGRATFAFSSAAGARKGMIRADLSDLRYLPTHKVAADRSEALESLEDESDTQPIRLQKVSLLARLDERTLEIGGLTVSDPAVQISAQGTLPLGMGDLPALFAKRLPRNLEGDCNFTLSLDRADLAQLGLLEWLKKYQIERGLPPQVSGNVSARVRIHGPATLPLVEAELASEVTVPGSSFRLPRFASVSRQSSTAGEARERTVAVVKASGTSAQLNLDKCLVFGSLGRIQAGGQITDLYANGKSRPRIDLKVEGDTRDISTFVGRPPGSPMRSAALSGWDFPLAGRGHLELSIYGPLAHPFPAVQGTVSVNSGFLLGEQIERADFEVNYQAPTLELTSLSLRSALLALDGSGSLTPGKDGGALDVAFRLSKLSPSALANCLGLSGRAFAGNLGGEGRVGGTFSSPRVEVALNSQTMRVGTTDLSSLSAQLVYAEGSLTGEVQGNSPQGSLHAHAEGVLATGRINGVVEGKTLDLDDLNRTFVAVRPRKAAPLPGIFSFIQGNADATLKFSGSLLTEEGKVKLPDHIDLALEARPFLIRDERISDLRVKASFARQQLQIYELRVVSGDQHVVASGFVNLPLSGKPGNMRLAAMGSSVELDALARLLPGKVPEGISGKAVFGALVEGPLNSPEIHGYLEVKKPHLSALSYDNLRVDVSLEAATGLLVDASFKSRDGRGGSVHASLPFSWRPLGLRRDRELSVVMAIEKDDLASAAGLIPRIKSASAPISLNLKVGGTPDRLRVDGSVSLSRGFVSLAGSPSEIRNLVSQMDFVSGTDAQGNPVNKLTINKLQGRFLDANFAVSGGVDRLVYFTPDKALANDYRLGLSFDGLDLSKLNPLLQNPSADQPGAVSFQLPHLVAKAEVTVGKGESGFTEINVKDLSAASPEGSLLSCRGKVTFTQSDLRKIRSNLFDLTFEIRKFEARVVPYFHGEINTKGPDHLFLKNPSGEPVRLQGALQVAKGIVTMAARKEPLPTEEARIRPVEAPFWDVTITPGKDFFIILPRFRQPMEGQITITGPLFSPFVQGRLWARPGGRLVSLSEQWRTEKCDLDFWASISRGGGGWSVQYNGAIDFRALGEVTYRTRQFSVTMILAGNLQPLPAPYFEATPYLSEEEIWLALGHGEVAQRILGGENPREVLTQEIFNVGEAELARAILDPIAGDLKQALGLEALSLEYGLNSPIRIHLTKDVAPGISLSYMTAVTAAREEYEAQASYRLPERFSRGFRPKTLSTTYDNTKTLSAGLHWEWQF